MRLRGISWSLLRLRDPAHLHADKNDASERSRDSGDQTRLLHAVYRQEAQ